MTKKNEIEKEFPWHPVQTADGSWTLAHRDHFEWYHSADGALSEARDLYIAASGIMDAFRSGKPLRVLDVGLGLGYNALATIDAWVAAGAGNDVELVSLENDARLLESFRSGAAPWQVGWPEFWGDAVRRLGLMDNGTWQAGLHGGGTGRLSWKVVLGDARGETSLEEAARAGTFDFVWQDPFSPEKNPTMWGPDWFGAVHKLTRRDGVLMTYSVARPVREALLDTGWRVEKIPTTTRKKHWLRAFRLAQPGEPT